MKVILHFFAIALVTCITSVQAAPTHQIIHDKTDFYVKMDIAKTLSYTDISDSCGIVPANFKYLDHLGREHILDYLVTGSGCKDN